ncbi:hypothetical protein MHSWG343_03680 [Candidatus Mycoplasma haematohominis]|uniref:Uncharacterized protein n=1 Tax=Candidatus Mycoplasma haematohominis TaxID=1494318 RepID=A0A478FQ16_9MOLU|nr:hypothetical protein MHSWG343_03680 [Candidatus Mycoplasma haemohominis]
MALIDLLVANPGVTCGLGAVGIGVSVSGIVYASDAGVNESHYLLRAVPDENQGSGRWSEVMDGKRFHDAALVTHSYKKLIHGDKSYNEGNYLIYYGSEACPHCTGFLFGDQTIARGNLWLKRDKMSNGAWMSAFEFTKNDAELKSLKIKFLMFEDEPEATKDSTSDEFWTLPWARWEADDFTKGRIAGTYIRNDKSARDFRKVFQAAIERFGENVSGTPTILIYKNGVPKIFYKDKLPGLKDKEQDESLSNEIELKRYIKYYFTGLE